MTNEERAKAIAAEANKCCTRSDGYEEEIAALALHHINTAIAAFLVSGELVTAETWRALRMGL